MKDSKAVDKHLYQHWMHSHEEDTESETVYRPVSFQFPRSRGRSGFAFHSNGECSVTGVGPADRSQKSTATWSLEDTDHLEIIIHFPSEKPRTLKIKSIDKDKLIVEKQ